MLPARGSLARFKSSASWPFASFFLPRRGSALRRGLRGSALSAFRGFSLRGFLPLAVFSFSLPPSVFSAAGFFFGFRSAFGFSAAACCSSTASPCGFSARRRRALRLILGHNFFCAESRLCRFFPKRTALFRKTFEKMHRVLFLFAQILTSLTFRIKKSVFSLIQNHKSKTCYCLFDGSRCAAAPAFLLTTVCHLARVATGLAPYEALLSRQERECHPKRQKPRRPVFCIHYFKFRNSSVRISLRGEAFLLSPQ